MNFSVGDKIKHLLTIRDMNQADLVKVTGISKATVSDLINNKQKSTSIDTINRIARALRVSPVYFIEEEAVTPFEAVTHLPEYIRQFILDGENMDYLLLAHKLKDKELPPDVVEKIIDSYEALIKNIK